MRGLTLALLLAAGCSFEVPPDRPDPNLCQVWVYPPGYFPVLWTCTSGNTTDPPRLPCVERRGEPISSDGGAALYVPDCDHCTPAELLRLDPAARCTPLATGEGPRWAAADMAGLPVVPPENRGLAAGADGTM